MEAIHYSVIKDLDGNKHWLASGVFLGLPFVHLVTKTPRGVRLVRVVAPLEGDTECAYFHDRTYPAGISTNEGLRRLDKGTRHILSVLLADPNKKAPPLTEETMRTWVQGIVKQLVKCRSSTRP